MGLRARGRLCRWCGVRLTGPSGTRPRRATEWSRDHVEPLSMGGLDTPENIVLACHGCNNQRGQLSCHFFVEPFNLRTAVTRAVASGLGPESGKFRGLQKSLKSWHKRHPAMLALLAEWVERERAALGWSPLARLRDLEPPPQRVRTLRRVEEKARSGRRHVAGATAQAATQAAAEDARPPACERDAAPAAC